MLIRPDDVSYAVRKSPLDKSCGPDQITAEHLKSSSHRVSGLLASCFTGMLMRGLLLNSLLVPVVEDKTGKLSSVENDRPVAPASVLSKVLESFMLDRRQEYILTTDDQFGFLIVNMAPARVFML